MCICQRRTAAPSSCRATPSPSWIRHFCCRSSRSTCPANRRPGSQQTVFRYHNDSPRCGADLVTPHPRKPPTRGAWRLRVAKVGLVRICRGGLRETDAIFRWGGEEFLVLLPETGQDFGRVAAERLRLALEAAEIAHKGCAIRITVSIGVAEVCAA